MHPNLIHVYIEIEVLRRNRLSLYLQIYYKRFHRIKILRFGSPASNL